MRHFSTKNERKVIQTVSEAMFAQHLYEGLTYHNPPQGRYGLVEAYRHWQIAKNDMGEYGSIDSNKSVSYDTLLNFIEEHDTLVSQLEDFFTSCGLKPGLTYEELEQIEKDRRES